MKDQEYSLPRVLYTADQARFGKALSRELGDSTIVIIPDRVAGTVTICGVPDGIAEKFASCMRVAKMFKPKSNASLRISSVAARDAMHHLGFDYGMYTAERQDIRFFGVMVKSYVIDPSCHESIDDGDAESIKAMVDEEVAKRNRVQFDWIRRTAREIQQMHRKFKQVKDTAELDVDEKVVYDIYRKRKPSTAGDFMDLCWGSLEPNSDYYTFLDGGRGCV